MAQGVYPNIERFLDDKYPELQLIFELVDYQAIPGKRGMTFLLPSSDFIKDLTGLIKEDKKVLSKYSSEVDYLKKEYSVKEHAIGHSLARWFLQALVLTQYYPTPESFKEGKVINKLSRMYTLKNASKDKVELSIGTLTPNKEFSLLENTGPFKNNDSIVVWNLSGKPEINTEVFEQTKRSPVSGGGLTSNSTVSLITKTIFCKVLDGKLHGKNLELSYITSLLEYIKKVDPTHYNELLDVISWNPFISLYLLLQPGNSRSMVKDNVLKDWVTKTFYTINYNSKEKYTAMCDEASKKNLDLSSVINEEKDKINELNVDAIHRLYSALQPRYFGVYKSAEHKINHDVLRAHYMLHDPLASKVQDPKTLRWFYSDANEMVERMINVDTVLGEHPLNPKKIGIKDNSGLKSFMKTVYFVFHIRIEQNDNSVNILANPEFSITKEQVDDLVAKFSTV